jgi:erythromycin esterase
MLEFLVTEMGFTLFAIEANLPEARAVNEYVLNGKGDPAAALKGLYFWTWNTEEVLELILWMRRYNVDPKHTKKLKFLGVDMQTVAVALPSVIAYLTKVDPPFATSIKEQLGPVADDSPEALERLKEKTNALLAAAMALEKRFDTERARYIRQSTPEQWAFARQDAIVVRQFLQMSISPEFEVRDRCMAENVRRILDDEGPGAKIVLWAHNGHVAKDKHMWTPRPMGRFLREALGDALYAFGFSFHRGSFRAYNLSEKKDAREGVVPFTVQPPPAETLEGTLAATGMPILAMDLRRLPKSGPAHEWLRRGQLTREVGAVFSDEGEYLTPVLPLDSYDGLLFVENTTPSRGLPSPKKEKPAGSAQ